MQLVHNIVQKTNKKNIDEFNKKKILGIYQVY